MATLIVSWYVAQTTQALGSRERIDRAVLRDPWDRLIVATALALALPLVTWDAAISRTGLVETLW